MAVRSDSGMYNIKPLPYISSSAYYVPTKFKKDTLSQEQQHTCNQANACNSHIEFNSDMETDEITEQCYVNNRCVITENSTVDKNELPLSIICQNREITSLFSRENRKRNSAGDASCLDLSFQSKRFRDGRFNCYNYSNNGTGSSKSIQLAPLQDNSKRLLNDAFSTTMEDTTIDGCSKAAGKYKLIYNGASKNIDKCKEYEDMLLETHGCSVYHHYRQQQVGCDIFETEF